MGHIYYRPSESRYCTSCLWLCGSDEPNRTLPCLLLWRSDLSSSSSDEARGSCWSPNIIIVSVCLRTDRASLVDRIFCCSFTLAVVIVLACDSSVSSVTLNWTTPNRTKYLRNSTTHEFGKHVVHSQFCVGGSSVAAWIIYLQWSKLWCGCWSSCDLVTCT